MHHKGRPGAHNRNQSVVYGNGNCHLYEDGKTTEGIIYDTHWRKWLANTDNRSITFIQTDGERDSLITLRRYPVRRNGKAIGQSLFWHGFKKNAGKLHKTYVGKVLSLDTMHSAYEKLRIKVAGKG